MKDLFKRSGTAVLFALIVLGSIIWNPWSFSVVFLMITILGVWEFYGLVEKEGAKTHRIGGSIGAIILFGGSFFACISEFQNLSLIYLFIAYVPVLIVLELARKSYHPFRNISFTLLGIIYVAAPFATLNFFALYPGFNSLSDYQPEVLIGFIFLIWTNDTGAYFVGSLMGKHKLLERISPGKTWEGTIGGGILTVIVAYVISNFFISISLPLWISISVIISIFGPLGDLIASSLKRSVHVKDSGKILPGHGGILDRFDAVLITAPIVFTLLILFT